MASIGRVIQLPIERISEAANAATSGVSSTVTGADRRIRRLATEAAGEVDDWGRDPGAVRLAISIAGLRWRLAVGGDQRLPRTGPALIVVNTRARAQSVVFAAFAISRCVDRPVRFVGRPDAAVSGSFAQRLGGLIDDPNEVAGALRAGELVVVGAAPSKPSRGDFDVGIVDHTLLGAAVTHSAPVFPTAAVTSPADRRARIEIGSEVLPARHRRGPLHELELADVARDRISTQLAELGDIGRDTLFDWMPFEVMARQLLDNRFVPSVVRSIIPTPERT